GATQYDGRATAAGAAHPAAANAPCPPTLAPAPARAVRPAVEPAGDPGGVGGPARPHADHHGDGRPAHDHGVRPYAAPRAAAPGGRGAPGAHPLARRAPPDTGPGGGGPA